MPGFGPPPKPGSINRGRQLDKPTQILPAEGRKGDPPPWPFPDYLDPEIDLWPALWRTPQAAAWERLGYTRVVARYCRALTLAELPHAPVALMPEVRHLEDRLGLTPMAMLRLRWVIAADELGERRPDQPADGAKAPESDIERRRRLRAA